MELPYNPAIPLQVYTCDTVIYNMYLVLYCSWYRAPKILGISCNENLKGVFCYINGVTFGAGCQENQPVIRGLKLSVPPSDLRGEKGWRLNLSLTASDLIICACVMKSPLTHQKEWGLERFWVEVQGQVQGQRAGKPLFLFPCLALCISSIWLFLSYILYNKSVT